MGGKKKNKRLVYFMSKMLQDLEVRYQKIGKLACTLVISVRKIRPCFQSQNIVVKMKQPIRQVLRIPKLAKRMISWSVELSKFSIKYQPRRPIKAQVLANFVVEITLYSDQITTRDT